MLATMKFTDRVANVLGFTLAAEVAETELPKTLQHSLEDLWGIADDIRVTRDRAMSVATISKGRRVVASTIGRMTLTSFKGKRPSLIQPSLLMQPERDRPLSSTLTWTVDALMFHPCTWWIVQERDANQWPLWVKLLDRKDAQVDSDGKLTHAWGEKVAARDVILFESIDAGLLHDARVTIQRAIAINKAAALAEDNPVPSVDLHWDGDDIVDEKIEKLVHRWVEARKTHGVGFSSKGLKVNTLGLHPEQLLIDGRKSIQAELARHIGVPAWALDIAIEGASMTYTNRASRNWELIDIACAPYMTAITSRLSMGDVTPRGWTVQMNSDELTRDDMKTRFETYRIGKGKGGAVDGTDNGDAFITNQQIAEWEGWDTPA